MFKAQKAIDGVISNFPNRLVAWWLRRIDLPAGPALRGAVRQLGRGSGAPADRTLRDARPSHRRHVPAAIEDEPLGALEVALGVTIKAEPIEAKIRAAQKEGRIKGRATDVLVDAARAAG